MLDSYFFIPADSQKFIQKMYSLDSEYFVLDLEDSVADNNKNLAYENIININIKDNYFCRVSSEDFDTERVQMLVNRFEGRLVIPKINSIAEVESFVRTYSSVPLQLIVLVENPQIILALPEMLKRFAQHVWGIGFGNHDFCAAMGMKHSQDQLAPYRKQLILVSKAFNVRYIDGVDLNIRDHDDFIKECMFAYEAGADGKFTIHPSQLESMHKIEYLSKNEVDQLYKLHDQLNKISFSDMDVVEIDGKVYEKPHFAHIKKVISKLERWSKKKN